ncbi:MAG: RICIN domain-containing protein [Oligoflexales bacterium]
MRKQITMKSTIYKWLVFTVFFGKCLCLQAAEAEFHVRYKTFLMLGSPTTGKSSLTNLLLNHLKEELEGNESRTLFAPAYKFDRRPTSELLESLGDGKFFRVSLGQSEKYNPILSLSATQTFESYVCPDAQTVILDTPGSSLANASKFIDKFINSMNSLDTSLNIRLAQGILFFSLSIADINAIAANNPEALSAKFNEQKNALAQVLRRLPDHVKSRFSIILCPEYNSSSQNALTEMQEAISGMSPLRRIVGNFIGEHLGLRILASQVFALDLGDAWEAKRNSDESAQNHLNNKILTDLMTSLSCDSNETVAWNLDQQDGGLQEQTSNQNPLLRPWEQALGSIRTFLSESRNLADSRYTSEINVLGDLSEKFSDKKHLTSQGLNRFSAYYNEASTSLSDARQVLLEVRRHQVEVRKLDMDDLNKEIRKIKIAYPDEFNFSRYTPEYFTFGLSSDRKFIVKRANNNDGKFPIIESDSVPIPQIKHELLDSQNLPSLFMTEFSYQDYPALTLELDHGGSPQNVNNLVNMFAAEALPFHQRGRLTSIFNRGKEIPVNILSEKLVDDDSIEINIPIMNQDYRQAKLQALSQCANHLSDCKEIVGTCRENLSCLSQILQSLSAGTNRCINHYPGRRNDKETCHRLDYISRHHKAPLTPQNEFQIVEKYTSTFQSASRSFSQTQRSYDSEINTFPDFPDAELLEGDSEVKDLKSLLGENQISILNGLKYAFEKGEIVSYEHDGTLRYISKNPGLLRDVYNLTMIPRYLLPHSNMAKVKKYLDGGDDEHLDATFSLKDARDDLKNRVNANKNLNILLFGPKGSGKSTLTNVLNHYASTIDINRKNKALGHRELHSGPEDNIGYLWNEDGAIEKTWVDFYYQQGIRPGILRSVIPNSKPENSLNEFNPYDLDEEEEDGKVPTYQVNGFKYDIDEYDDFMGTAPQGNIIDSFSSQMPYIVPEYRLNILDSSGLLHKSKISGGQNHKVFKNLDHFEGEKIDGICLVLDLRRWWDENKFQLMKHKREQDYFESIKKQLDDILKVQQHTKLPLNIIITHASDFFHSGMNVEEVKKSLRSILSKLLGKLKFGVNTHVHTFEFGNLWQRGTVWPIDFKANLYEAGRLLEGITKQSQSIKINTFKNKLKDQVNEHMTHFRIKWGKDAKSLNGFDIESSPNHNFIADVRSISKDKLYAKVKQRLEKDWAKLSNPKRRDKENLPYLVGIAVKNKHPKAEARIELFPLHHLYDLGKDSKKPKNTFPWAEKKGWDSFDNFDSEDRLDFKGHYAEYQAERLVSFLSGAIENNEQAILIGVGDLYKNFMGTNRYLSGIPMFRTYQIGEVERSGCLLARISSTLKMPQFKGNKKLSKSNLYVGGGLPVPRGPSMNHEQIGKKITRHVRFRSNSSSNGYLCAISGRVSRLGKKMVQYSLNAEGDKIFQLHLNSDGSYAILSEDGKYALEVPNEKSNVLDYLQFAEKSDSKSQKFHIHKVSGSDGSYYIQSKLNKKYLRSSKNTSGKVLNLEKRLQKGASSPMSWRIEEMPPLVLKLDNDKKSGNRLSAQENLEFTIKHDK